MFLLHVVLYLSVKLGFFMCWKGDVYIEQVVEDFLVRSCWDNLVMKLFSHALDLQSQPNLQIDSVGKIALNKHFSIMDYSCILRYHMKVSYCGNINISFFYA